jgi:hypothetical protein
MENFKNKEYFCKSELLERGWTLTGITKFLKFHDLEKINPKFKNASSLKLFKIERVKQIEETDKFKIWLEENKKKKISSEKAVKTKETKLLELINSIKINVLEIPLKNAIYNAIDDYYSFNIERDRDVYVDKNDIEFINRITVNWIRHKMTEYDDSLLIIFNKTGKNKAYQIINQKIYFEISSVYPELKDECNRQLFNKTGLNLFCF